MFNKSGVNTEVVLDEAQILLDVDNAVSVACVVPQDFGLHSDGKIIVKAGTPFRIDLMKDVKIAEKAGEYSDHSETKTEGFSVYLFSSTLNCEVDVNKFRAWVESNCHADDWNYQDTRLSFDSSGSKTPLFRLKTSSYYYPIYDTDLGITVLSGDKKRASLFCPFFNHLINSLVRSSTAATNVRLNNIVSYFTTLKSGSLGYNFDMFKETKIVKLPNGYAEFYSDGVLYSDIQYDFETLVRMLGISYEGQFQTNDWVSVTVYDGDLPPKTTMNAVLLHDVEVTDGDSGGTALIFGSVNVNRVSNYVRDELISELSDYDGHAIKGIAL